MAGEGRGSKSPRSERAAVRPPGPGAAGREAREQEKRLILEEVERESKPVLADLAAAGLAVRSISDLYNDGRDYRAAIPILIRWLPRVTNVRVKELLVRALSHRSARPSVAPLMVAEFRQAPPDNALGLKWAIGNALSVVADDSVLDAVVDLVRDRRHGRAREMLAEALANMRNPRAVDVLIELLDDEEVAGHAIVALGKLKAAKARPAVERFLGHREAWVRNAAKRSLAKIDRAAEP